MKEIKVFVICGIITTMTAYAQDGGKQQPKKEETKTKEAPKQEVVIKQKSSNIKENVTNQSSKTARPAVQPEKEGTNKANSPK
ncbi:MAG: hypothetical protein KatS3mg027_1556 [Bacteroidia bacterium]|nr:MAG: hypothetical protein KatS3mg027_1556 [Bacteroidia bacterium]